MSETESIQSPVICGDERLCNNLINPAVLAETSEKTVFSKLIIRTSGYTVRIYQRQNQSCDHTSQNCRERANQHRPYHDKKTRPVSKAGSA